jgi:hypothetical protein
LSVLTCRMRLSLYPSSINPLFISKQWIEGLGYSIFDWNGFTISLKKYRIFYFIIVPNFIMGATSSQTSQEKKRNAKSNKGDNRIVAASHLGCFGLVSKVVSIRHLKATIIVSCRVLNFGRKFFLDPARNTGFREFRIFRIFGCFFNFLLFSLNNINFGRRKNLNPRGKMKLGNFAESRAR